jgi:hypothetical protein
MSSTTLGEISPRKLSWPKFPRVLELHNNNKHVYIIDNAFKSRCTYERGTIKVLWRKLRPKPRGLWMKLGPKPG